MTSINYDFLDGIDPGMLTVAADACEGLEPDEDYVVGIADLLLMIHDVSRNHGDLLRDWLVGNRTPKTFIVSCEEMVETEYRVECYTGRQAAGLIRRGECELIETVYSKRFLDRVHPREATLSEIPSPNRTQPKEN